MLSADLNYWCLFHLVGNLNLAIEMGNYMSFQFSSGKQGQIL
jgi:hypothetical protein